MLMHLLLPLYPCSSIVRVLPLASLLDSLLVNLFKALPEEKNIVQTAFKDT